MSKEFYKVPGPNNVILVIDLEDADTPAMIFAGKAKQWSRDGLGPFSSTYHCAVGEGVVDDQVVLTSAQMDFLESERVEAIVETAYEVARPEGWNG